MKRVLPFLSIAILMVACNSKDKQSTTQTAQPAVTVDTTGFAQYQLWKAQHELSNVQDYQQQPQQEVAQAPAQQVKIIRVPVEHTRIIERQVSSSSHTADKAQQEAPAPVTKPTETTTTTTSAPASTSSTEGSTAGTGSGTTAGTESGTTAPEATQKKTGMSNKTKDAVIGGVIGGAAGAVINKKNPVVGAVIGAVLGGGGGYIIGKKADQKQGRN